MSRSKTYTLFFLVGFYGLLGGLELLAPQTACQNGLAGPLTAAGSTPKEMCSPLHTSPAGQLVLFGLGKYHALFSVIAAHALLIGTPGHIRAVLLLNAINFAMDDAWAAVHVGWIKEGPVVLIPQAALVAWLLWLSVAN